MVTNAGAGWSTCRGLDVTRWRRTPPATPAGQFCYVRDLGQRPGLVGRPPADRARRPTSYEVIFSADKAEFRRRDGDDRDAAGGHRLARDRRRGPPAHADQPRHAPADARADQLRRGRPGRPAGRPGPPGLRQAVPRDRVAAAAGRRCSAAAGRGRPTRSRSGPSTSWLDGRGAGRARPSTRPTGPASSAAGRTPADPAALDAGGLSGHGRGRCSTRSSACGGGPAGPGGDRDAVRSPPPWPTPARRPLALADQYQRPGRGRRGRSSWPGPTARSSCSDLGLSPAEAPPVPAAGRARPLPARRPAGRARPCAANRQGQPALWRHGISGDLPILLVLRQRVGRAAPGPAGAPGPRLLARPRVPGGPGAARRAAGELPRGAVRQRSRRWPGRSDSRRPDRPARAASSSARPASSADDRTLLLGRGPRRPVGDRGPLADQIDVARPAAACRPLARRRTPPAPPQPGRPSRSRPAELRFANGTGGLHAGRPRVRHRPASRPPAPWINVSPTRPSGFLVTDSRARATPGPATARPTG